MSTLNQSVDILEVLEDNENLKLQKTLDILRRLSKKLTRSFESSAAVITRVNCDGEEGVFNFFVRLLDFFSAVLAFNHSWTLERVYFSFVQNTIRKFVVTPSLQ